MQLVDHDNFAHVHSQELYTSNRVAHHSQPVPLGGMEIEGGHESPKDCVVDVEGGVESPKKGSMKKRSPSFSGTKMQIVYTNLTYSVKVRVRVGGPPLKELVRERVAAFPGQTG